MQVLKFGGTSVANAENIKKSISIVCNALNGKPTVMVVSALAGTTDQLIATAKLAAEGDEQYVQQLKAIETNHLSVVSQLIPVAAQSGTLSLVKRMFNELDKIAEGVFIMRELSPRALDRITGFGELLSSRIVSASLESQHIPHHWLDSRELIQTDSNYGFAAVDYPESGSRIREAITSNGKSLYVLPGFIAADKEGITTTLGRGGSDYSAAILAAELQADVLEIWTDVSGMMTADPRLVSHAKVIPHISYSEAMELSHFGAKVIYAPTIQPVMNREIPVWIKNTFAPADAGTQISGAVPATSDRVCGLSSIGKIALLSLEGSGMVGIPGISRRLFEALSEERINVMFITQSSSEYAICVAVEEAFAVKASKAVDRMFGREIAAGSIEPLKVELSLSMIALVGDRMRNRPGISGKMFSALGRNGVNVRAIAQGASEKNISAVISHADLRKAINVLHEEFFENSYKQVNLFIVGLGNVGSRLLEQLAQQQDQLRDQFRLQLRIRGMANSRKMVLNEEGISLDNWKQQLEAGNATNLPALLEFIKKQNFRNTVFVDVTASGEVPGLYEALLLQSVSVVACNKIACSSGYDHYRNLKGLASDFNASFLFETNVGASLPIIGTLNDLIRSGDSVRCIEAVLSGTLNYVFNNYDGTKPFATVVRQAQAEGYTEPDPRTDLSGTDVMRKILILARESGYALEMADIGNEQFLPPSCMEGNVEQFYEQLLVHEAHFKKIFDQAQGAGAKLKYVATFKEGKAFVGLQHISPDKDMYHLYGKDNVVVFYTARYQEQPLVIKGAGAGAEVTASGIFADIVRAGRVGV